MKNITRERSLIQTHKTESSLGACIFESNARVVACLYFTETVSAV
jgi:hypothetical protein